MSEQDIPSAGPSRYEVVAIASSSGGLNALTVVLAGLPAAFPWPVLVVQHLDPRHHSVLAQILQRLTGRPVREARDGERLEPGVVYVAPSDHHLIVDSDRRLALVDTVPVNFVRPSADRLFGSVAAAFGAGAIAIVLSGSGHDGAKGVTAVKQGGGLVLAQDRASSEFFGMPGSAIATGAVDLVLPLAEIPRALVTLLASEGPNG